MKLLLKFQLLSQSAANLEQKNVRIQVDSPSTLREVAVLGMQKAGFDPEKVEISSATKGSHPTTVCLDDQPTDLGVYSVMLRERIKATSDCGAFWMSNPDACSVPPAKQRKRLYILLLGAIGTGKSTFINMVANCAAFETIAEACSAACPLYAVPTEFTARNSSEDNDHDDDFQTVRVGPVDPQERFGPGSNTQDVRFYRVFTDQYEVVLVDTPGTGDPQCVHRDQINMHKVVNAVAALPYINLVVKFLKATDCHITESYRYCVTELLMRLHNSAIANIAFCFTHSRSFFFRPGESVKPLNKYLKDMKENHGRVFKRSRENSFSIDNEAIRFIYAFHNNVHFEQRDADDFAISWKRTVSEIHRMLDYAASIEAHDVHQTVSVNQAREAVLTFAKPLTDINDLIESNKRLLAERQRSSSASTRCANVSRYNEQAIIKHVSILFAVYLKMNATLPFNDCFEAYVKICIANEEMCLQADNNRDTTKLDNLKRSLAEYRQERDTIVTAINAGDDRVQAVSHADITAAREQLFKLEHYGAQLKELYDATLAGYELYKGEKAEVREPQIWTADGNQK